MILCYRQFHFRVFTSRLYKLHKVKGYHGRAECDNVLSLLQGHYIYSRIIQVLKPDTLLQGHYIYSKIIPVLKPDTLLQGHYIYSRIIQVLKPDTLLQGHYIYSRIIQVLKPDAMDSFTIRTFHYYIVISSYYDYIITHTIVAAKTTARKYSPRTYYN